MASNLKSAGIELNRINSLEYYELHERLFMILNLKKGPNLTIFKDGREAKEEEIGTALWMYHNALNAAERQIEKLLSLLKEIDPEANMLEDYLEEYSDTDTNYRLQEVKASLYISMAKNDEKSISKYINQLNVLTGKEVAHG